MVISPANRIQEVQEYYFSRKLAEVRQLDTPAKPVINLGIGSPDLAPSSAVTEALCTTALQANSHGYQSYRGIPALRAAIADFSRSNYGTALDPATEILPLMGSKEGIMHISLAFLNPGDEVLVPDPGYPTYSAVAALVGAKARTYTMDEAVEGGLEVEKLALEDLSRVKLMWINYPHMPTGIAATEKQLEALVQLAREKQFLLVNDNPYSLILNPNPLSVLAIPGAEEVALELNSLSKSHNMAGWRIGWLAGSSHYIEAILRVKSNMDSGMFLGLQQAAVQALNQGAQWFEELTNTYARRKKIALQLMEVLGCCPRPAQAGMFVWAKVPDAVEAVAQWIDEILYATHVFITPGFVFGPAGERYIRLSLCSPELQLQEALERIQDFLRSKIKTPTPTESQLL